MTVDGLNNSDATGNDINLRLENSDGELNNSPHKSLKYRGLCTFIQQR
jgi:hypothetical protein